MGKQSRARATPYIGLQIAPGIVLTKSGVERLFEAERRNARRARAMGATVEDVNFLEILIAQEWICCICGTLMDPNAVTEHWRISVEHDPALSISLRHDSTNVRGAHLFCNHQKGIQQDTQRAAKMKRVTKEEKIHIARMALKEAGEALPKGAIRSRGFSKPSPHLKKRSWPKRSFR